MLKKHAVSVTIALLSHYYSVKQGIDNRGTAPCHSPVSGWTVLTDTAGPSSPPPPFETARLPLYRVKGTGYRV